MPSPVRAPRLLAAPLLLTAALVGCGGSSSGSEVTVSAGDDNCAVSETELAAGTTTFAVTNDGDSVTEVYVYGEKDGAFTTVVGEVENVGPGINRDLEVDLAAGRYEVACKPGQNGDGIRQEITVTGTGGAATASDEGYDRELELTVDADGLNGLDPATGDKGERIEVKLQNDTDGPRTLEVVG
ncbi:MAG: cupredoxin domain-containing protein, partial [Sporichthyaceae bacterium]